MNELSFMSHIQMPSTRNWTFLSSSLCVCVQLFFILSSFFFILQSAFCCALWESYQLPIYIWKAIMEATKLSFPNLWNYIRFVILPLCFYRFLLSLYCPSHSHFRLNYLVYISKCLLAVLSNRINFCCFCCFCCRIHLVVPQNIWTNINWTFIGWHHLTHYRMCK